MVLIAEWPAKVMGDDVLLCWPEDFGDFYEFANGLITPATTLMYTNENVVVDGVLPPAAPLINSQILSFGFTDFKGVKVPFPMRPNKMLARLNFQTPKEDPYEVVRALYTLTYFHPQCKARIGDMILSRWGHATLQKFNMSALNQHLGYQSKVEWVVVDSPSDSDSEGSDFSCQTSCYTSSDEDDNSASNSSESNEILEFSDEDFPESDIFSQDICDLFQIEAFGTRDTCQEPLMAFLNFRDQNVVMMVKSWVTPTDCYRWWYQNSMGMNFNVDPRCAPADVEEAASLYKHSIQTIRHMYIYAYEALDPNDPYLDEKQDLSTHKIAPWTLQLGQLYACLHLYRQYVQGLFPFRSANEYYEHESCSSFSVGKEEYKSSMALVVRDAAASGSLNQIGQKKKSRPLVPKQKRQSKPKSKSKPRKSKASTPRAPKPKLDASSYNNTVNLFRAMVDSLNWKHDCYLPDENATNVAHFYQRWRRTFKPNADGTLKYIASNNPDTAVLVQLDEAPDDVTLVKHADLYRHDPSAQRSRPFRIFHAHHVAVKRFFKDGLMHMHDPAVRELYLYYKWLVGQRHVDETGHRVALPGPMVSSPITSYSMAQPLEYANANTDSWFYNNGQNKSGFINNDSVDRDLNAYVVDASGQPRVNGIYLGPNGQIVRRNLAPVTISGAPKVPLMFGYPSGSSNIGVASITYNSTITNILVKVKAGEDYKSSTGLSVAIGSTIASGIVTGTGAFNLAFNAPTMPPPDQNIQCYATLACTGAVPASISNFTLNLSFAPGAPDDEPGWYAFPNPDAAAITDGTNSLTQISRVLHTTYFGPMLTNGGGITQATVPEDTFGTGMTLSDLTKSYLANLPDSRQARASEGGYSIMPPYASQASLVSQEDLASGDDDALETPLTATVLDGLDPTSEIRLEYGAHRQGPSKSLLYENRPRIADVAARQHVTAALAVMPHHDGNPLGAALVSAAVVAFKLALKAWPMIGNITKFAGKFKESFDKEYASRTSTA